MRLNLVLAAMIATALALVASLGASAAQEPTPAAAAATKQPAAKKAATPAKSAAAAAEKSATPRSGQAIVLLVNDEPVTAYEIDQRARFMSLSANIGPRVQENFKRLVTAESTNTQLKAILEDTIKSNQGKTKEQIIAIFEERKKQFAMNLQKQAMDSARASVLPGIRKQAEEELIEGRLKIQEAKKLGVDTSEEAANNVIKDIASRNKQTPEQFAQNLRTMGADIQTMRDRFAADLAWRSVIQRKFSAQISVAERDVDKLIAATAGAGEDTVELQLHKITLSLPSTLDQAAMAKRLSDADNLRRKFGGCKNTATLVTGDPAAKFEDLKFVRPSTVGEPTRTYLLNAKDGEMLPPQTGTGGVEVYAVCGRRVIKADEQKRSKAQQELQAQEYERLAKRHLRDLRQDAHIEYR